MHFYNDNDARVAAWLGELVACGHLPPGDINTTSISDLTTHDLTTYTQCHFFAGIGGWPLALKLSGWPNNQPVWTGSCPCQPFSVAGRGGGTDDPRHLWPAFHRLITLHHPPVIFGEQVAGKAGRLWLAGIRADLEALGYAVGAADLCAAGVGAPHIRQRLWWVAYSNRAGGKGLRLRPATAGTPGPWRAYSKVALLAADGLAPGASWPQPLLRTLDDGVSGRVARHLLHAYGNAIVPPLAAEFIIASVEAINSTLLPHPPNPLPPPLQTPTLG